MCFFTNSLNKLIDYTITNAIKVGKLLQPLGKTVKSRGRFVEQNAHA